MTQSETAERSSRIPLVVAVTVMAAAAVWLVVAVVHRSWMSALLAALVLVTVIVGSRWRPLELVFDVGHGEQHRVIFRYNRFWGNLAITVDGRPVVRDLRLFSVRLTKTYRFTVGAAEVHDVRIEKDRKLMVAGVRPQPVRAYVDDVLTAEGVA